MSNAPSGKANIDFKLTCYYDNLKKGMTRSRAAITANLSQTFIHRLIHRGEEIVGLLEMGVFDLEEASDFDRRSHRCYTETLKVEAEIQSEALTGWKQSFNKDWRSAQAYLEVRFPEEWKPKKDENEGTAAEGVQVNVYLPDNSRGKPDD